MASQEDHIQLANRCHCTLYHLLADPRRHPEWITTISFYKALHVVEAVLAGRRLTGGSHAHRLNLLKSISEFKPLHKSLRPLWSASMVARYLVFKNEPDSKNSQDYPSFSKYMSDQLVISEVVNRRLKACEDESIAFLGEQAAALDRVSTSPLPEAAAAILSSPT